MANTNEVDDKIESPLEVPEFKVELAEDGVTDNTDWKKVAEDARKLALEQQGIAQRNKTRFEKAKAPKTVETTPNAIPKTEVKSEGLDYGQKAFLIASGVKDADEIALVEKSMKQSGLSLEGVLENGFFKSELQGIRDTKAAAAATPAGGKRGGNPIAAESVDYWLEKYNAGTKFEDIPEPMQQKVLDAKISKEKSSKGNFSANPVIAG